MNILKYSVFAFTIALFFGISITNATAQDRTAAVQAFNKARDLAESGQYDQSITKFEEAIAAGKSLGPDGADIVKLSKKQLPGIFYQKAVDDYKAYQKAASISSLDDAINAFKDAVDAGKEYGNKGISDKSSDIILKLSYQKSVLQYRAQNYDAALATANKVISTNPNYANAYYQKALILKKTNKGSLDEMTAMLDKTIEVGEKTNNAQIVRKAKEKAASELVYLGSTQTQKKNYAGAIESLNKALEYDATSADAYYRLAETYNGRGEWQKALDASQKALDNEKGGRTAKAKIYFQMANAYKGKGNFSQACSAFSNAAYGGFKNAAEHQMEYELKCSSKTN